MVMVSNWHTLSPYLTLTCYSAIISCCKTMNRLSCEPILQQMLHRISGLPSDGDDIYRGDGRIPKPSPLDKQLMEMVIVTRSRGVSDMLCNALDDMIVDVINQRRLNRHGVTRVLLVITNAKLPDLLHRVCYECVYKVENTDMYKVPPEIFKQYVALYPHPHPHPHPHAHAHAHPHSSHSSADTKDAEIDMIRAICDYGNNQEMVLYCLGNLYCNTPPHLEFQLNVLRWMLDTLKEQLWPTSKYDWILPLVQRGIIRSGDPRLIQLLLNGHPKLAILKQHYAPAISECVKLGRYDDLKKILEEGITMTMTITMTITIIIPFLIAITVLTIASVFHIITILRLSPIPTISITITTSATISCSIISISTPSPSATSPSPQSPSPSPSIPSPFPAPISLPSPFVWCLGMVLDVIIHCLDNALGIAVDGGDYNIAALLMEHGAGHQLRREYLEVDKASRNNNYF